HEAIARADPPAPCRVREDDYARRARRALERAVERLAVDRDPYLAGLVAVHHVGSCAGLPRAWGYSIRARMRAAGATARPHGKEAGPRRAGSGYRARDIALGTPCSGDRLRGRGDATAANPDAPGNPRASVRHPTAPVGFTLQRGSMSCTEHRGR